MGETMDQCVRPPVVPYAHPALMPDVETVRLALGDHTTPQDPQWNERDAIREFRLVSTNHTTPEDPRWNDREVFSDHAARTQISLLVLEIRALKDKITLLDDAWTRRYDALQSRLDELEG